MKPSYRLFHDNGKEETQAKRPKVCNDDSLINKHILDEKIQADFLRSFRGDKDYRNDEIGVSMYMYPFKHCIIHNLVKDEDYLEHLKKELSQLQFTEKSNDLYKFKQSNDLKTSRKDSVSKLRKLLYKDCLDWMKSVTNMSLDDNAIDMSCAKYTNTDVLLCHDDELEGRRIAYIFYLVPSWTKEDGGSLDLFNIDEFGQPDKIVKSLVPEWNSLVFFEVTPVSFHQDEILISWINPMYLQPDIVDDIRKSFEDNSEIELKDFLLEEKYDALLVELKKEKIKWQTVVPANKRRYETAAEESLTSLVQECFQLFKSEPMFKLLTKFTGLKLSNVDIGECDGENERESGGKTDETSSEDQTVNKSYSCYGNVCRWSHGCYTLIHDNDPEAFEMALDALFYLGCHGWEGESGGYTSYLAREEDEELLAVYPCSNSLALVYRDTDTLKFVKHINNRCKNSENDVGSSSDKHSDHYYNIMCTYFE